jgi:pyrroline-5-carboxylate reductase
MSEHHATARIVLAGFGNMGLALASGWIDAGISPAAITVLEPYAGARTRATDLGMQAVAKATDLAVPIDVVVLAVKPALIDDVLAALSPASLYLSIAAGRSIAGIARGLGNDAAIIRAMPNTPATIGLGMTGLCASAATTGVQRELAASLMAAVGQVEWLDDEADMDAVTAVSGSGPAYVFLLIECLTAAAIEQGLAPELAERLATATVHGAGAYAAAAEVDAATLRQQVTSPGGTTEAALGVLREGGALEELLRAAVAAAARRSRELGSG